jgi:hypothetical protein
MPTRTASLAALIALALAASAHAADPDAVLRAMSDKLAASKSFAFTAQRHVDAALREGHDIPEKARVTVLVQRPARIDVSSTSREGARRFVADGKTLTVADAKAGTYARVPMRGSLDALVDRLDREYGFVPPLAEFVLSDLYADLKRQARTIAYRGTGGAGGGWFGWGATPCHRIALQGPKASAEIWVGTADSLPRKLVATFARPGAPRLEIRFLSWDLAASHPASAFAFQPPANAQKVEMWTPARVAAGR